MKKLVILVCAIALILSYNLKPEYVFSLTTQQTLETEEVEQFESIEEQIKTAKEIETEAITDVAPNGTKIQQVVYVPKGDSWNVLISYAPYYVANGRLISFNVDSKEVNETSFLFEPPYRRGATYEPGDFEYTIRHRSNHFIYKDRVIATHQTKYDYDGEIILTYDIETNEIIGCKEIEDTDFKMIVSDANDEGIIRGSGYSLSEDAFMAFEYNPYEDKLTMSSKYKHSGWEMSDYSYSKTVSYGDWLIAGLGANPWRLLGYNFKTEEWRLFLEVPGIGSHRTIMPHKQENGKLYIFSRDENGVDHYYMFDGENFLPTEDGGQEGSEKYIHPLVKAYPHLGDEGMIWFDRSYTLDNTVAPPQVDKIKSLPNHEHVNNITFDYNEEVVTIPYEMKPDAASFSLIGSSGDYIYGTAPSYGEHIFYNTETGESTFFNGTMLSVYSMNCFGDKVYMAGYPNFELVEYDLSTMTQNRIGHFQDQVHTHRPFAGIEQGSDGNIYFSGRYYRNRENGTGGIAWYNPITKEKDGIELNEYEPYWMTSIENGDYMVMSCKSRSKGTCSLVILDVATSEIVVKEIEGLYTGSIVGVGDYIVGHGISDADEPIIYKVNPHTGEIIWQCSAPEKPYTSVNLVRSHYYVGVYDHEDYVYFNVGEHLVKIHVDTGVPEVMGKLPKVGQIHIMEDGSFLQAGHNGFVKLKL